MGRTWGRLYLGTRNHRKIKTLRRRHPGSWKAFYVLLEMALETNDDGWIFIEPGQPYPIGELADEVDETPENLQGLLDTMAELGMIQSNGQGVQFLSYSERQFKSDEDAAERKRKSRERAKASKGGDGRAESPTSHSDGHAEVPSSPCDGHSDVTPNGCDGHGEVTNGHGEVTPPENRGQRTETELVTSPSGEVVDGAAAPSADPTPSEPVSEAGKVMVDGGDANGAKPPKKFGPAALVELWNDLGCRPRVSELTDERRKKAALRIRKRGDPDWWGGLFEKVKALNKAWLTFDFLIRSDTNCLKVMEGNYDHDFGNCGHGRAARPGQPGQRTPRGYDQRRDQYVVEVPD
jgi:hypothetical protein